PPVMVPLGLLLGGGLASAGSLALNSSLERGIDARMNRTKGRPLPSGRIMPPANALLLAAVLLFAGFLLSYLLLNLVATLFIILGATIYISLYTILLKPRTTWNIVLGGSAGSCVALVGWYLETFYYPFAYW